MRDGLWRDVHEVVAPLLEPTDRVLAPRGDWAAWPCPIRFYDALIDLQDDTVLVLHKGRMPGMDPGALAAVVSGWQCLHANAVFVVFARQPRRRLDVRLGWRRRYLQRLRWHLDARRLRVLDRTIYYVHVPKAGGTSAWDALSRTFRSSVYYGDIAAFQARPPEPRTYDLVGLHFSPLVVLDRLRPGDLLVGLLREPVARLLSSVVHSRRDTEDPGTLGPSMRAMRDTPLSGFLDTPLGRGEAQLQLALLGAVPGTSCDAAAMLEAALQFAERDDVLFAPTEDAKRLIERLFDRLGRKPPLLSCLNTNKQADYQRHAAEFSQAMPQLLVLTAADRQLFDAVRQRFHGEAEPHR